MHFKLAYKEYEYKPTWNAFRSFEDDTGESMLGLLYGLSNMYYEVAKCNVHEGASKFLAFCPETVGAKVFYYLAKECNSHLTIEEMHDAIFHTSNEIPKESDSFSNPWYLVLVKLAGEVFEQMNKNALKKKPEVDS